MIFIYRRRSNLFTPSKKTIEADLVLKNQDPDAPSVGSGRSIPIRQGILYKKSNKSTFSKDWKKKYVTLSDDGKVTYHPSLNDYMSNVHGKEIPLQYVTVKVPGQKPRGSRTVPQTNPQVSSQGQTQGSGQNQVKKNCLLFCHLFVYFFCFLFTFSAFYLLFLLFVYFL